MNLQPVFSSPFAADLSPGTTAASYTNGKTMGTVMTIPAPTPVSSGPSGPLLLIETLLVSDAEAEDGDLDLVLFDSAPTAVTNNSAWNPSAADLAKVAGVIQVRGSATPSDWSDFSANSAADKSAILKTIRMKNPPNLYGLFIARSAITFAAAASLKAKLSGFVN